MTEFAAKLKGGGTWFLYQMVPYYNAHMQSESGILILSRHLDALGKPGLHIKTAKIRSTIYKFATDIEEQSYLVTMR